MMVLVLFIALLIGGVLIIEGFSTLHIKRTPPPRPSHKQVNEWEDELGMSRSIWDDEEVERRHGR